MRDVIAKNRYRILMMIETIHSTSLKLLSRSIKREMFFFIFYSQKIDVCERCYYAFDITIASMTIDFTLRLP